MCMSCNSGRMTRKRIVIFLIVGGGIAAGLYGISLATNNFAVLALSPLALGFFACPLMCGLMGGVIWLMARLSKRKEGVSLQSHTDGCCQHGNGHGNEDAKINANYPNKEDDNLESRTKIDNNIDSDFNTSGQASQTKI